MSAEQPIPIAVVGLGNWGRNHLRTLAGLPQCRVKYMFDHDPATIAQLGPLYPRIEVADGLERILGDDQVRAMVIATSARSHGELARRAIEAGKDVFIEKPMTLRIDEGRQLVKAAERRGTLIQVGHLLLFHPAVAMLKQMIRDGDLGRIHYIYSQRLNLGVVRSDENSLWSLAPHDISLANHLLGDAPHGIDAIGGAYLRPDIEDVIFMTLTYPGGRIAHIHVSWLDPHKVRRLTIVGSAKMAVFDDMEPVEKIRIYDKGAQATEYDSYGVAVKVRTGDTLIPAVPNGEPLREQALHFLDCVRRRQRPRVDGRDGLEVVRVLQEATGQLHSGLETSGAATAPAVTESSRGATS